MTTVSNASSRSRPSAAPMQVVKTKRADWIRLRAALRALKSSAISRPIIASQV